MGGTLSCGGQGHKPTEEDKLPYGVPVSKPVGIVQPQEKAVIEETDDISKPIPLILNFNNNNNNNTGLKPDAREAPHGRSWKFWKSMTLRGSKKASSSVKLDASLPDLGTRVPETFDRNDFTRSLSLRPPPKPPRTNVGRSHSLRTPIYHSVSTDDVSKSHSAKHCVQKPNHVNENSIKNAAEKNYKDYENVDSEFNDRIISEKSIILSELNYQKTSSLPNSALGPNVTRRQPLSPTGKIKIVSPDLTRRAPPRPRKKSAEITAEDRHILILQSTIELICQKVDPFVVIEKLSSAGLIEGNDLYTYRNPYDSRQLSENVIQSVMDRDYHSFLKFCDILRSVTDNICVVAILDAMVAVYDVIYDVQISTGDSSPLLDEEKSITFDVVYYNVDTGKVRSVVELEKLRNTENKRHSRDLLSFKRNSRLSFQSFQSLASDASSVFSEDMISNGFPMIIVSISGHALCSEKAKSLANVMESHNCFLEFHLGKTSLKGQDMERISLVLAANTCIRLLDLRLNSIGNSGAVYMANVLYQNRTLKQLNISSTGIDGEGCKVLADSLRTNSCLEELDMSFLDIGDNGCLALSGMLKQNRTLKKLRLRSASISWIGCGLLLEGIEIGKIVTELDLSRNFIGDTGVEVFFRHMKDDSSLREVNLENCGITANGCSTLSDVILTNKSLRNLDLSVNFIGDQGILKLSNALSRNKHIKTLGLNMCGISNDGFSKLLDILEGNATLTLLKLCYNRLGREHVNPEATSDNLKYRIRIVTSSNPKLKLLLWGNTFEESNAISQYKELNSTL